MKNKITYLIFGLIAFTALVAPFSHVARLDSVEYFALIVAPEQLKTFYFAVVMFPMLIIFTLKQGFSSAFTIVKTNFYLPILAFLVYCVITFYWAPHLESATNLTTQYLFMALSFFLIINLIKNKIEIINFFNIIIFIAVIASILGLLQYYFYDNIDVSEFIRQAVPPASTFGNKNMLVHFLVLSFPISIGLAVFSTSNKKTFIYTLASVIIALIMMHTKTRAGWVAGIMQIILFIFFLIIDNKRHKTNPFQSLALSKQGFIEARLQTLQIRVTKIAILIGGVLLWLILINYTQNGWEWNFGNIAQRVNDTIGQSNGRIPAWVNTLEMIKDNFWFGVGSGSWQHEYALYYDMVIPDVVYNENVRLERLHNDYLEVFANVGLVGFSFLIVLLIMIIKTTYKLLKSSNYQVRQIDVMIILALVGFSVSAMFSFPLRVLFPGVLVMIYIAFIVHLSSSKNQQYYQFSFSFGKLLVVPLLMLTFMFSWMGFNRVISTHYDKLSEQLSEIGAHRKAFFSALTALSYDPYNYQTLFLLARTSLRIGKIDKAIELLERVHKLNPRFDQPLLVLALAYLRGGQNQKAIKALHKLLKLDPRKVKAHAMMTQIYIKEKDVENVKKYHELMLKWAEYFKDRDGFSDNKHIIAKTMQMSDVLLKK